MRRGGDACVALVLIPRAPAPSCQGDASVPTPPPLSRVGILPCRFGSPFVPVGAGEGLCGVGTLASPWQEGESVHRSRTRATQASPPHVHTTPAPTNVTICPQKADP